MLIFCRTYCTHRVGILDVFLACIAKGLTLQVKSKGRDKESHKTPVSTLTMATIFNDCQARQEQKLGSRWWMRGTMPRRVAESIIQLVRDMASVCNQFSINVLSNKIFSQFVL